MYLKRCREGVEGGVVRVIDVFFCRKNIPNANVIREGGRWVGSKRS